ncbi:MAG: hypothetical protein M1832_001912 [Thelocarpon impressellum]|nr:MAG: hypothetical protein M1832_001912 [Thelocarpon impressellum]
MSFAEGRPVAPQPDAAELAERLEDLGPRRPTWDPERPWLYDNMSKEEWDELQREIERQRRDAGRTMHMVMRDGEEFDLKLIPYYPPAEQQPHAEGPVVMGRATQESQQMDMIQKDPKLREQWERHLLGRRPGDDGDLDARPWSSPSADRRRHWRDSGSAPSPAPRPRSRANSTYPSIPPVWQRSFGGRGDENGGDQIAVECRRCGGELRIQANVRVRIDTFRDDESLPGPRGHKSGAAAAKAGPRAEAEAAPGWLGRAWELLALPPQAAVILGSISAAGTCVAVGVAAGLVLGRKP